MVQYRLKTLMKQNDITQKELSELLGIRIATLNYKLNGKNDFTQTEINKIIDLFQLPYENIFFNQDVPIMSTN